MLSLEECKKLCPSLEGLPDSEVAKIRDVIYQGAQLSLEDWMRKNRGSKNLKWSLPDGEKNIR